MSYDTLPEVSKTGKKILTSHPEFGEGTNGSDVAEAFAGNIKGRNVVITGVSPKSLGETLAVTIARHAPANLILASRTLSKLEAVAKSVRQTSSQVDPKLVVLDLGSLKSVRQAAADISQLVESIDVLINNAAVVSSERRETADGLEQTFGTNHVGHFLFTSLLTPLLLAGAKQAGQAGTTRVVNVTSLGYRLSPIRFHDYNFEGKQVPSEEEPPQGLPAHMKPNLADNRPYQGFCAYGQSKTANILHCVALNQKLGSKGIKAFAVHPGSIWTDLSRNLTPEDLKIIEGTSTSWITQDQGTASILVAAFDPMLAKAEDQVLLNDCQFTDAASTAHDPDIAERLWQLSEKLTGERAKF